MPRNRPMIDDSMYFRWLQAQENLLRQQKEDRIQEEESKNKAFWRDITLQQNMRAQAKDVGAMLDAGQKREDERAGTQGRIAALMGKELPEGYGSPRTRESAQMGYEAALAEQLSGSKKAQQESALERAKAHYEFLLDRQRQLDVEAAKGHETRTTKAYETQVNAPLQEAKIDLTKAQAELAKVMAREMPRTNQSKAAMSGALELLRSAQTLETLQGISDDQAMKKLIGLGYDAETAQMSAQLARKVAGQMGALVGQSGQPGSVVGAGVPGTPHRLSGGIRR